MKFTLNGYIFTTNRNFHVHSNVTEGMIKEAIFNEIDNILCLIEQGETNISITHDLGFTIGFAHCVKCPPKFQGVYFPEEVKDLIFQEWLKVFHRKKHLCLQSFFALDHPLTLFTLYHPGQVVNQSQS